MDTPLTDHLTLSDYKYVYEPAEDSFLLLDALETDLVYLENIKPLICLEIGSGSGVLITALAKKFPNSICLSTDINPYACNATKRTAQRNAVSLDPIQCNLADAIRPSSVDVLLFNPPYVVTSDEEWQQQKFGSSINTEKEKHLVHSWAGGYNGRRVIDELLQKVDDILSPHGVIYLLLLRENKPNEIIQQFELMNFKATQFMQRRIPGEYLFVLKATRL